jgi:hypothetical protein
VKGISCGNVTNVQQHFQTGVGVREFREHGIERIPPAAGAGTTVYRHQGVALDKMADDLSVQVIAKVRRRFVSIVAIVNSKNSEKVLRARGREPRF